LLDKFSRACSNGSRRLGLNRVGNMKINKFSIPISMTAALVGVIACAVSCAKKNQDAQKPLPAPPEKLPANSAATTNAASAAKSAANPAAVTNAAAPAEITNPPPAETTTKAAATITVTDTNLPGHTTVVEMPATTPVAPTNFYAGMMTNSSCCLAPVGSEGCTNFFFRFRAGYEHVNHGDNNDSYSLSAKVYAYGNDLREQAGKNGWLIPDADAEVSSQYLPKPDHYRHGGSDNGLRFRADFTWPWIHWTTLMFAREDSICPFCRPLTLGFGPTVNVGFDHLYDETEFRFARYAGVRLTFNRDGFIEYTAGGTDGLAGTRQQVVAEIPFCESRDGEVRYYLRGLWNRGTSDKPDILEGGIFVEMPLTTLISPAKWGDLVPFVQ
jgi:hypothetical protein